MPIYEYQCTQCSYELEALQKISDAPLIDCPQCHKAALKKKISAAAFRLKGGGWYETDFKSGSKKNLAGEGSADKSSKSSDSASAPASTSGTGDSSKSKPSSTSGGSGSTA